MNSQQNPTQPASAGSPTKIIDFHNIFKLKKENIGRMLFYQTGKITQVFNEDALILNRMLKYKIILLGIEPNQYLKVSFPSQRLQKIFKETKDTLKINYTHFQKENDTFNTKHYSIFKSKIKKSDLVKSSDIQHFINNYNNQEAQDRDFTINQIKRGATSNYQLHIQHKNLYKDLIYSIIKNQKKSAHLTSEFLSLYSQTLLLINKTRNSYTSHDKHIFHLEISSNYDTLKDYCEILYTSKSFKNQKQYLFILNKISTLHKINFGLLKNNRSPS